MDYRDLECATRDVYTINDVLRDADLGTVGRAADIATSVAEATRAVEVIPSVCDLMVDLNDLMVKPAELISGLLPVVQRPAWLDVATAASIGARQPSWGPFDDLFGEYQQVRDGISAAKDMVGSISQATELLRQPMEIPFISTVNSITDTVGSITDAARVATDWKPVLMQFSPPLETVFATRLSASEQAIYSAIRPEILSVADQLSRVFELPLENTFVDYMGTLFELDFGLDPEFDLDAPPADELPGMDLERPRWLGSRRLVVWLADRRPIVVELVGVAVGEVAGTGTGLLIDGGAAGALVGNGLGGVLGVALGKGLVVVVKRCRARL